MSDEAGGSRSNPLQMALAWFFVLAALAMFFMGYLPARWQSERLVKELEKAQERTDQMKQRTERLSQRCEALAKGDPDAMDEAIREVLHKGRDNEYILRTRKVPQKSARE